MDGTRAQPVDRSAAISARSTHNSSQQWLEKHMPTNLFSYHLPASSHELFILCESGPGRGMWERTPQPSRQPPARETHLPQEVPRIRRPAYGQSYNATPANPAGRGTNPLTVKTSDDADQLQLFEHVSLFLRMLTKSLLQLFSRKLNFL